MTARVFISSAPSYRFSYVVYLDDGSRWFFCPLWGNSWHTRKPLPFLFDERFLHELSPESASEIMIAYDIPNRLYRFYVNVWMQIAIGACLGLLAAYGIFSLFPPA